MALVSQPEASRFRSDMRPVPPSVLLRTYRHLLPAHVRRAIRTQVAPETWELWKTRLEGPSLLGRRVRHECEGAWLRHQGRLSVPDHTLVMVEGRTRIALVREGLTPLAAREWNLQAVCSVLQAAGVPHFAVRGFAETGSVIGVSAEHRTAALTALRAITAWAPAYLSPTRAPHRHAAFAGSDRVWERLAARPVFRVSCYQTDGVTGDVYGPGYGCDIEVWEAADGTLTAPRPNKCCDTLPREAPPVEAAGRVFTPLASADTRPPLMSVSSRREFSDPLPEDVRFPVDVVYTWVDGDDPAWQQRRAAAAGTVYHPEAANDARYASHDELRFSLRSLHQYAPWVRHVYLVTDRQRPAWLNEDDPGITVVDHREIFTDPDALPTFNSHAIESQLHHIDGLSEHFLYFNDDVFLGRPVVPQRFFLGSGVSRFFLSKAHLPTGLPDEQDVPVSAAGKNNRRLLAGRFGSSIAQKMKHTPSALQRSVLYELEQEFAESHRATARSRFRSMDDIAIANSLHHYYAYHTGRAVPGRLRYDYVDTAHPDLARRLRRILVGRSYDTFCLNDTVSCSPEIQSTVLPFLESYFPVPSPFERAWPGRRGPAGQPPAAAVPSHR